MSRNKKVASHEKHPLLDETCRSYMESAINSYHLIAADLFAHMGFLLFWFNHSIAEATPENSMCSTFNYFIGENTSNIPNTHSKTYAEEYFKKIIKHYNKILISHYSALFIIILCKFILYSSFYKYYQLGSIL